MRPDRDWMTGLYTAGPGRGFGRDVGLAWLSGTTENRRCETVPVTSVQQNLISSELGGSPNAWTVIGSDNEEGTA